MRQIYTSPRVENIERVVALMDRNAIETRLRNHEVWRAHTWKRFSYLTRDDRETWPQVWVVKAEDQTRARQVMREAGLEPAIRFGDELAAERAGDAGGRRRTWVLRWKLVTFALLAGAVLLVVMTRLSH